jgi:hypothetical protein
MVPAAPGVRGPGGFTTTTTTTTTTRPSAFGSPETVLGGFQGVASTSSEKSLRIFNGRTKYNEWLFLPGQPRIVGRPMGPTVPRPGGPVQPGQPGQPGRPFTTTPGYGSPP